MAVAQRAISVQNRPLEKRGGPTRIVCLDTSYGWTFGTNDILYKLCFIFSPSGSEDDTATNFTPLTNFIVLPNGFLPSHPGSSASTPSGGVHCRVKLKDRFKTSSKKCSTLYFYTRSNIGL